MKAPAGVNRAPSFAGRSPLPVAGSSLAISLKKHRARGWSASARQSAWSAAQPRTACIFFQSHTRPAHRLLCATAGDLPRGRARHSHAFRRQQGHAQLPEGPGGPGSRTGAHLLRARALEIGHWTWHLVPSLLVDPLPPASLLARPRTRSQAELAIEFHPDKYKRELPAPLKPGSCCKEPV